LQLSGFAALRLCSYQALQLSGFAALRLCSSQALQLSGFAALRLCSSQALQLSGFAQCEYVVKQKPSPMAAYLDTRDTAIIEKKSKQKKEKNAIEFTDSRIQNLAHGLCAKIPI